MSDIPSTWIDVTDTICSRPRQGLIVGDPTEPDIPGRKVCAQCANPKPMTTGFFHRDPETEDGFADVCNSCKCKPIRKESRKHRNSSYLLDRMAIEQGYESQADMIRDHAKNHGTIRSLAMALDIGTMTAYKALKRCGATLKGAKWVSWTEPRHNSLIGKFAIEEGWESEFHMLQVLARTHRYPVAIAAVVGVSSVAIKRKLTDWGIAFEDGRGKWRRRKVENLKSGGVNAGL